MLAHYDVSKNGDMERPVFGLIRLPNTYKHAGNTVTLQRDTHLATHTQNQTFCPYRVNVEHVHCEIVCCEAERD